MASSFGSDNNSNNEDDDDTLFVYRGWSFICRAQAISPDTFQPTVMRRSEGGGETPLPQDTEAYGTEAEALRHAQQQAMRWVNDRTGDGQGQF